MQRRTFLRLSILGAAVLGAGAVALRFTGRASPEAARNDARVVLRAAIPALLAGVLPPEPGAREAARQQALDRTMGAIDGLPEGTREELDQLFGLLASHPGRWLAGVDWETATPEQVAAFLQRWRTSSFDLFVVGYQAMHDLVLGSWYADPSTWEAIGYPGPAQL
ncbi:MAG TPA: hypothetical protein VLW55_16685 [Burkholderiaceae bacterium]|nr:hypothetical protein [Burkholderiaceae bacterium]